VYIAVMEVLLVRQFSKTKNVVNRQKTKKKNRQQHLLEIGGSVVNPVCRAGG